MAEVVAIVSILFLIFLIYTVYNLSKLHNRKNQQFLMDLENIKSDYERNLLNTQIEIQEQTFQNISREIHDSILQKLTLAKLYLYTDRETKSDKKNIDCLNIVTEVINDLGDISRSLNSDLILRNGLIRALEAEILQIKKLEKHAIDLQVNGDYIFLNNKKELILFRIIQESLNNILKHANSKCIQVLLNFKSDRLMLEVKDDGRGFDPIILLNNHGAGIANMIERAKMIGGELQVKSMLNKGTSIQLQVPYDQ